MYMDMDSIKHHTSRKWNTFCMLKRVRWLLLNETLSNFTQGKNLSVMSVCLLGICVICNRIDTEYSLITQNSLVRLVDNIRGFAKTHVHHSIISLRTTKLSTYSPFPVSPTVPRY